MITEKIEVKRTDKIIYYSTPTTIWQNMYLNQQFQEEEYCCYYVEYIKFPEIPSAFILVKENLETPFIRVSCLEKNTEQKFKAMVFDFYWEQFSKKLKDKLENMFNPKIK